MFEKVEGPVGMGQDDTLGEQEGVDDRVLEFEGVGIGGSGCLTP